MGAVACNTRHELVELQKERERGALGLDPICLACPLEAEAYCRPLERLVFARLSLALQRRAQLGVRAARARRRRRRERGEVGREERRDGAEELSETGEGQQTCQISTTVLVKAAHLEQLLVLRREHAGLMKVGDRDEQH